MADTQAAAPQAASPADAPAPQEPLIELKGISKSFGSTLILDEIDLSVWPGEAVVVIGPSGTGKSTILRIIAGLMEPDSGEVCIQGQRRQGAIDEQTDPLGISMVFQQSALFDSLSVDENVGFLLYQHSRLPRRRVRKLVEECLEMVGLDRATADKQPAELSGGMRKRVSFARAILSHPEDPSFDPTAILYDEPTAGLDPIASTVIEDLVRRLQREAATCSTYIMVSHQDSTIRRTADRVVFLYDGKVQWQGGVGELDTTDHPMVRQFFAASTQGPIRAIA